MCFRLLSTLKRPAKTLMELTVYDAFFRPIIVFKSLRFHLSRLKTERFQKALLLVIESLRFHQHFSGVLV